jgi:putative ABC transport system permease protein
MSVARRNMMAGKGRTLLSIAGVAIATVLLLFVLGLYRGWNDGLVRYIRETRADVWVVGSGADSFFTPSILFNSSLVDVRQTPGVTDMTSIIGKPMNIRRGRDSWQTYVVGFDTSAAGGPVEVSQGSGKPKFGEIVIDDVLARTSGLGIGDEVRVGTASLKVVGISKGGNLVLAQLSFVNMDQGRRSVLGIDAIVNFALLQTEPGRSHEVVDAINRNVPGVTAFDSATFAENSQAVLQRSVLPILLVIVLLAVVVGTIVVGLTVYTGVVEKEREFGVLKALGQTAMGLCRVVFEQSMVCGLAGFVAGLGTTYLVSWAASAVVPQVTTVVRWQDVLLVLAATAIMSLVAGLLPMQRVVRVDTLSVFKA